jgi:myo-inositol-1(or 4)-monophosphatase
MGDQQVAGDGSVVKILDRIREALDAAGDALSSFIPGKVRADFKSGDDPVTEADRAANRVLRDALLRDGEGWLSEESEDDLERLRRDRVWIVDPVDGTREFVVGIPEWCVSVALVEKGQAVAGGIFNPATSEVILGGLGQGVTCNGRPAQPSRRTSLEGARVLASRSEVKRGEWDRFQGGALVVQPMGSVAYKLALVAAGKADATWTLTPKHEWDIAAGVALIEAGKGFVRSLANSPLNFNNRQALLPGLIACGPNLRDAVLSLLEGDLKPRSRGRSLK